MKEIIEKSIEKWVKDNSLMIAQRILKNDEDDEQQIPFELLVFSCYLEKVRKQIFDKLSCSHRIMDIKVSFSDSSLKLDVTVFFDTMLYNSKYGNNHCSYYSVERIIEYFDNYLNSVKIQIPEPAIE